MLLKTYSDQPCFICIIYSFYVMLKQIAKRENVEKSQLQRSTVVAKRPCFISLDTRDTSINHP